MVARAGPGATWRPLHGATFAPGRSQAHHCLSGATIPSTGSMLRAAVAMLRTAGVPQRACPGVAWRHQVRSGAVQPHRTLVAVN